MRRKQLTAMQQKPSLKRRLLRLWTARAVPRGYSSNHRSGDLPQLEDGMKQKISIELDPDMQTKKHGIVRDDRGQTQPADKQREQQSQMEGPAAYAPHEDEKKAYPKRD